MKKSELFADITKLFSNEEFKNAGITDIHEYIHDDLTVEELKKYRKWYNDILKPALIEIERLRNSVPGTNKNETWKMYAVLKLNNYETNQMKLLLKNFASLVKKTKPEIKDRVISTEITDH